MGIAEEIKEAISNETLTVTYAQTNYIDWDAYYAATQETRKIDDFRFETPVTTWHEGYAESFGDLFEFLESSGENGVNIPGVGTAVFETQHGGEGQGDEYWYVFKLVTADEYPRYFKVDGYYTSYEGGYYDELYEVFPKQVQVTQWAESSE